MCRGSSDLPKDAGAAEALRILLEAEKTAGPNPERVRDALASGRQFAGVGFSDRGETR